VGVILGQSLRDLLQDLFDREHLAEDGADDLQGGSGMSSSGPMLGAS
jgi:hypothetical protein